MWVQGEGAGSNGPQGAEEPNHHGLLSANIWHRAFPTSTISALSLLHWLAGVGPYGPPVSGGSHSIPASALLVDNV